MTMKERRKKAIRERVQAFERKYLDTVSEHYWYLTEQQKEDELYHARKVFHRLATSKRSPEEILPLIPKMHSHGWNAPLFLFRLKKLPKYRHYLGGHANPIREEIDPEEFLEGLRK